MGQKIQIRTGRYFAFVGSAAAVNVLLFFIGQAVGATYDVKAQTSVNLGIVIGMTVAQLSVGYLFARLASRFAPKAFDALVWFGVAFAIITAPGGWLMSQDAATGIVLGLMHLTGAVTWFLGVRKK